ncbi:MAG: His-Xaa-Ser system radical SAM maturase HxsC [Gammaproteobacteria bacterium]
MLKLYSKINPITPIVITSKLIAKLTDNKTIPMPLRSNLIFLSKENHPSILPEGFIGYLTHTSEVLNLHLLKNVYHLPSDLYYLSSEDIVSINPGLQTLRTLYRRNSHHNSLLVTENCNNYCLMCSQPPRNINDRYIVNEILTMIPLMSRDTREVGITGGEPTLLGDDLIAIFKSFKNNLPNTALHVLTNGRNFVDTEFVAKIASIEHHDLMFGIPVYSDVSNIHDYVVQADNAYNETIKGIINLKSFGLRVEIRVVLHKQTYQRLPKLAEFIARNLLFVDHVALMGLEMTGFTKANINDLWIDPVDYQLQLEEAIDILARAGINVSVYNHQLCLIPESIWRYTKKSISDWKNGYMPECEGCEVRAECGGFFSSAHFKYSSNIKPVKEHNKAVTL